MRLFAHSNIITNAKDNEFYILVIFSSKQLNYMKK